MRLDRPSLPAAPSLTGPAPSRKRAAAAGGAFMNLNYHWKLLPLPTGLMIGHALLAAVGFVMLILAAWR